ncbi:unnamed protein product [Lathyrus sativus]|nr:unnamed protein product [Lathyrus sativus]
MVEQSKDGKNNNHELLFVVILGKAMLAAIILSAVPGLINYKKAYEIWKVDKLDFLACAGAFLGVLFSSVEIGLVIGVMISFAKIILISIQPGVAIIGRFPGTNAFGDVEQYPMAINMPGVLVVCIRSGWLCFANASAIRERQGAKGNEIIEALIASSATFDKKTSLQNSNKMSVAWKASQLIQ